MYDQIGEVLAARRRTLGLSQGELAEALSLRGFGVTNQAVSKWEKGATLPNARQLLALCEVLEIEDIRGVRSDAVVNRLVEYNLIAEKGRRKSPGRPVLFGTTDEFLRNFGYSGIKDLPHLDPANAEELEQIHQQEIAQFGEPQPAEPVKKPRPDAGDPFP